MIMNQVTIIIHLCFFVIFIFHISQGQHQLWFSWKPKKHQMFSTCQIGSCLLIQELEETELYPGFSQQFKQFKKCKELFRYIILTPVRGKGWLSHIWLSFPVNYCGTAGHWLLKLRLIGILLSEDGRNCCVLFRWPNTSHLTPHTSLGWPWIR